MRIGLKRLTEIAVLTPFTNTENSKQEPGNLNAELVVHVSDATLVRALKDLETGSIPFSRRGDILQTIGYMRRMLKPLLPKPPSEEDQRRSDFEAAN